jgi:uncharacterized protein (DUF4415 family)
MWDTGKAAENQRKHGVSLRRISAMREEYDFSKSTKNPYAKRLRKPVTIRLGVDIIDYFRGISEETGIPYQTLINLYLRDCAQSKRKLDLTWIAEQPA